jgi:hypothetical protein
MTKNMYQPIIIENAQKFIDALEESNFFEDYGLDSTDYAFNFLCEKLNEKYIKNNFSFNGIEKLTSKEFTQYLQQILSGSILETLKEKGFVESYEDENTEKIYFLTDLGKQVANILEQEKNNKPT